MTCEIPFANVYPCLSRMSIGYLILLMDNDVVVENGKSKGYFTDTKNFPDQISVAIVNQRRWLVVRITLLCWSHGTWAICMYAGRPEICVWVVVRIIANVVVVVTGIYANQCQCLCHLAVFVWISLWVLCHSSVLLETSHLHRCRDWCSTACMRCLTSHPIQLAQSSPPRGIDI